MHRVSAMFPALQRILQVFVLVWFMQWAAAVEPAQLVVWNRPIATLRTTIGESGVMTPQRRVERALQRIAALPDEAFRSEVIAVKATGQGVAGLMIMVDGNSLFAIAEGDVDISVGETLDEAARRACAGLKEAFEARIEQARPALLLRSSAIAIGLTAGLAVLLVVLRFIRKRVSCFVVQIQLRRLRSIAGMDISSVVRGLLDHSLLLPFWAAGCVLIYLWLTTVFSLFPYTHPWSESLADFFLDLLSRIGTGIVSALPGLFIVAIIMVVTYGVVRSVTALFRSVEEGTMRVSWMYPETAYASRLVLSTLLWLFAITLAYPHMPGSGSPAFQGVSVFAGLLFTLGSAGTLNQVMSGLVLIYSRSMRIGDFVKLGDVTGTVTEIGMLSTKVRTNRDEEITIPNASLLNGGVVNYTRLSEEKGAMVTTTVTIGYDVPWRQVHALLIMAAGRCTSVLPEPAPHVHQRALGDFSVEYELRIRIADPRTRQAVLSELHAQIQDAFNEHGVQIMSPHFESQPAQTITVPRDRWFALPASQTPAPER